MSRRCLGAARSRTTTRDELLNDVARTFAYDYNLGTGESWRTGPDGNVTYVDTDIAGRVEEVEHRHGVQPLLSAVYTYHPTDQVHTVTYGNGTSVKYLYDAAHDGCHRDGTHLHAHSSVAPDGA